MADQVHALAQALNADLQAGGGALFGMLSLKGQIRSNRVCRAGHGIWLDWMAQGTRASRSLLIGIVKIHGDL